MQTIPDGIDPSELLKSVQALLLKWVAQDEAKPSETSIAEELEASRRVIRTLPATR